jgi:ribosome-associated heat shock protein Hsp15
MLEVVRLDCYLWAIRMYKSRSLASSSIKNNKVKLNGEAVKASRNVKIGDEYTISYSGGVKKIIEVTALIENRQSFEIAQKHYLDKSPPIDKVEKLESLFFIPNIKRDRGAGRPTKKDKRDIDEMHLD